MASAAGKEQGADDQAGLVNVSCLELMLIELVPMQQRLAQQIYDNEAFAASRAGKQFDEDDLREATWFRLEQIGYRVGLGLAESLTANLPLPSRTDPLDTMKYLCKDLWTVVFRKQIDNLKTNHRGVFVLTDNSFYPLRKCSIPAGGLGGVGRVGGNMVLEKEKEDGRKTSNRAKSRNQQAGNRESAQSVTTSVGGGVAASSAGQAPTSAPSTNPRFSSTLDESKVRAQPFLAFPAGLIRGALSALGLEATVQAEIGTVGLPMVVFQIRLAGAQGQAK